MAGRHSGSPTRGARATRALTALVVALVAATVVADPFPPYWGGGSGAAVHYAPVAWPQASDWQPYTKLSSDIEDRANNDESNGGTSPQSYVNVSSGCTDQTLPSVYYAYDAADQVLFFRWRVQAPPHTYATGPSPGTFGATSPWSSALWTVFIDTNGDGYRDFAVHLDGSSGGPSTAVDRISAIWSNTRSQSLDYLADPNIHLIAHNPTAFVDGPSASNRLLNFHGSLSPDALWPNGAAETEWDYGTTRATRLNTGCGEYFIDYQIPLAMLDATAVGGPAMTPTTPMSLFFATANSLNNPLQKDVVVAGDYLADPSRPVPGGDTVTPSGGTIVQPTISAIGATGCGPSTLSATVLDTLNDDGSTSVASITFFSYADTNADGLANDGSSWTFAANGTTGTTLGRWSAAWNTTTLARGRYLIGVQATDQQGHTTYSHLDQAAVNAVHGTTPPHFANPAGLVLAALANTCGLPDPSIAVAVSPSSVSAGQTVTATVTITNTQATPLSVTSITDVLPAGFTYQATTGGTLTPTTTPTNGDPGSVQWTFGPDSIPASSSGTLIFTATASAVAGTYTTTASASTGAGALASGPAEVGVGAPSLSIAKSASVGSASPGDPITYTIAYANPSSIGVTNAVITDVLPLGLDFVSATGGGSYHAGTRTVTWTLGSLGAGISGQVQLATTVTSPYPDSAVTPVVNTAGIVSTETSSTGSSSSVYVAADRARLSVQLEAASNLVAYNTSVPYTVTIANIGQAAAANMELTLPIPTGWSFVSATNGGSQVGDSVTWSLGSLAADASTSVGVTLRSGPAAYTGSNPVTTTATATATAVTPASDTFALGLTGLGNVCSTYYFRTTTADVGSAGSKNIANTTTVTTSDTGATASATSIGSANEVELASFYQDPATIADVSFNGNIASTMWVSRSGGAPAVLTGYVYDYDPSNGQETLLGQGTGTFNGNSVEQFSFNVALSGTLASGHRIRWRYSMRSQNTNSTVTLNLLYGGSVGGTLRNSNSSFCVTPPANPVVDAQVSALQASAGDALTYTIPFSNTGNTTMTSSTMAVTLPDGVSLTGATLNGGSATPSSAGQVHTFTVASSGGGSGSVAGGGSGTLVLTAQITVPFTGGGNTLTATAALDSTQTTAISDQATTVLVAPSVTIVKAVSTTLLQPGSTVTYTLDVLNGGPGAAAGVTVTDVLPVTAYYTYVPGSARLNGTPIAPDPVAGNTLSHEVGALAAGARAIITFEMALASSGVPAGVFPIGNVATVSDTATQGTRSSNTVTATVSSNPNLTFTKTSTPAAGPLAPGDTIVYTLTVVNIGSADALDVRIVDPVPANTTYVPGTLAFGATSLTDVADGDAGTFEGASDRVTFVVGTLAAGASRTYTYSVSIAPSLGNGSTTIGSTATATASNAAARTAVSSIGVDAAPALSLAKSGPANVAFPLTTLAQAANGTTITVTSAVGVAIGDVVRVDGTTATVKAVTGNAIELDTPVTASAGTDVRPTIEYVLAYANAGNAAATDAVIADTLPAGTTFLSASGGVTPSGGVVSWPLGTLAPGDGGTVRLRVLPGSPGAVSNTATLASNEAPTVTSNTVATSVGSLVVSKATTTPAGGASGAFTVATYVLTLENQSLSTAADDVTVADVLPAGFSYARTMSLTGATAATSPAVGDTRPTWTGLDIPAATTAVLTFEARINNVAVGTYQNEVDVTSTTVSVRGFDALATTDEDVSVAGVLGTTGVPSITPSILAGGTLAVGVADVDLDTDPAVAETIVVTVTNQRTNEADAVTLTETGPGTGVFTGTLATFASPSAGASGSAPMHVVTGDAPTVSYQDAFTGTGASATMVAASSVGSSNSNPTANDDAVTVQRNAAAAAVAVLANDTTAPDTGETLTIASVTQGSHGGVVVITGGGAGLTYQPAANASGSETFTYTVTDGNGGTDTATVTVLVNRPPTAAPDTQAVAENAVEVSIDVLANDTFAPDTGEYLFIFDTTPGSHGGTIHIVGCGTLIQYTPAPGFTGTETFSYTVRDGNGGEATATVAITVGDANSQPTAADDTASIAKNAAATAIDVLANDSSSPDTGETLTITAVTQGSHGAVVSITGGGTGLTFQPAPDYIGTETFTYTVGDGNGGTDTATVTVTVGPVYRRYFSEGVNNTAMATFVSLANPALVARTVHVEFYRQSGAPIAHDLTLGPRSRITIDTRTITGLANAAFATAIEADATVVAERTLTWNFGEPGSSLEHAVEASTTWYFAEGSTTGRFSLFYLLSNPNLSPATVTIDFLPQVGPPVRRVYTIAPRTRLTVPVNTVTASLASADLGAAVTSDLPIAVERSMYLSTAAQAWVAGTTGAGVTQPLTQWFFGEGNVGPFFDAWILLANPGSTPATAQVRYLSENGQETVTTHTVPVGRRITIRVAADAPHLYASSFGIVVTSTNGVPIVAERAMWWPNDGRGWYEGHVATGLPVTAAAWGVADGVVSAGGDTEDYVLIANTSAFGGVVKVTTVFDDDTAAIERLITIGAAVRVTLRMRTFQPEVVGKRFSVFVEAQGGNPVALAVEHSSYTNTGDFWGAGSSAPASPIQ